MHYGNFWLKIVKKCSISDNNLPKMTIVRRTINIIGHFPSTYFYLWTNDPIHKVSPDATILPARAFTSCYKHYFLHSQYSVIPSYLTYTT